MAKKTQTSSALWLSLAVTRILLGTVFLWAFVDKLFGFGIATPAARAWVNGGSPTRGFLANVSGPFADFFNSLAGSAFADWLFMLGLLGIGLALVLGIGLRIAAVSGSLLMLLMWAASLPLENHPVIDDHIIYAGVMIIAAAALPEQRFSLAKWWASQSFVKKYTWLR